MQRWYCLTLHADSHSAETIADLLQVMDALSVTFLDAKDEAIFQRSPHEHPLWTHTKIAALFQEAQEAKTALDFLKQHYPDQTFDEAIEVMEEQDWVRLTQAQFPPQRFGSDTQGLWVIPSWEPILNQKEPYIRIDPGLAFGTGTHPTTALCLDWIAQHQPTGLDVIDLGCGSGILSLAALALGASKVIAIDHDEQAIQATQNNALLNTHLNTCWLHTELTPITPPPCNLILANILANPLMELAPFMTGLLKPNATLVLSGLLTQEVDAVLKHYPNCQVIDVAAREEWARIVLT